MGLNFRSNGISDPEAYARSGFEAECATVASTGHGRNDQLNRSAYRVGQFVGAGIIDRSEAEHGLFTASQTSGYVGKDGAAAARSTIKSGLDDGMQHPQPGLNGTREAPRQARPTPKLDNVPVPDMTPPNEDGKPKFFAIGRPEPTVFSDEARRHIYWRDGEAVRAKVKKQAGEPPWSDFYKVRRSDGAIGWQAKKPEGFEPVPYIGPKDAPSPFDRARIGEILVWAEGEKDVDTLRRHGFLAFTFGSASDVPNCGELLRGHHVVLCADNDEAGERSIPRRLAVIKDTAGSVRTVRFRDFAKAGADASDFFEAGRTAEDFLDRAEKVTTAEEQAANPEAAEAPKSTPSPITARPFTWRNPKTFPRRQWLYGHHLIRRFISCTVAPGGVGKSSLTLVEAIAMATGRELLGVKVHEPLRVWVINLEDPLEETERRAIAICLHFGIDPAELDGRLFLNSGRDTSVIIATTTRNGTEIAQPVVDALKAEIRARGIDVVVIDPLVKAHRVPENDNGAIDMVCTAIAGIADETGCAFDLVHHVRKTNGAEVTVEDGRGAVALLSAARSARALNRMTKDEAEKAGIEDPKSFFRAETGKANLAPADKADWFKLVAVSLGNSSSDTYDNSDRVAVAEAWTWPDALLDVTVADLRAVQNKVAAGRYRESSQAANWVGKAVAEVLRLDLNNKAHHAKVRSLLKTWTGTGMFVSVDGQDEARRTRSFVEVGQWASD